MHRMHAARDSSRNMQCIVSIIVMYVDNDVCSLRSAFALQFDVDGSDKNDLRAFLCTNSYVDLWLQKGFLSLRLHQPNQPSL